MCESFRFMLVLTCVVMVLGCQRQSSKSTFQAKTNKKSNGQVLKTDQLPTGAEAMSLLGKPLFPAEPTTELLARFQERKREFEADPENADKMIWYGRFTAYQGKYREAIAIYTDGIKKFPDDPRFYRHRGHRYISIREFDKAIADFETAVKLIKGKEDQVEPDGMPNDQDIPVSTLHTNIWYHLGLAHYLKNDLEKALAAYEKGIAACTNDDMLVAFTHWAYMANRQLGKTKAAEKVLEQINKNMQVIESFDYHQLCLFYKRELTLPEIESRTADPSRGASEALQYGIANWYFCSGKSEVPSTESREKGIELFKKMITGKSWSAFGYIAAEANLAREKADAR